MQKLLQVYEPLTVEGIPCTVGFGAYGTVQLARIRSDKGLVALKKIPCKLALNQIQIHQSVSHNNIIKVLDFFFGETENIGEVATYIVLEYAANGTLFELISEKGIKEKAYIKTIFKSVCSAIQYLHSSGIMHRDIKPENILLDKSNTIKLCDFGFASSCEGLEPRFTICGTAEYMAPEMILNKRHNHKVDVWGLGILLFEMIEGHAPFQGNRQDLILEQMKSPLFFSEKFQDLEIDLIQYILKVSPNERPEISEFFGHPWIVGEKKKHLNASISQRSTQEQEKKKSKVMLKGSLNVNSFFHDPIPGMNKNISVTNFKTLTEEEDSILFPKTMLVKQKSEGVSMLNRSKSEKFSLKRNALVAKKL